MLLLLGCVHRETKVLVSWPRCGDNPFLCSKHDSKDPNQVRFEKFLRVRIKVNDRWRDMRLDGKQGQCWKDSSGKERVELTFSSTKVRVYKGKTYRLRLEGADGLLVQPETPLEWNVKVRVERRSHRIFEVGGPTGGLYIYSLLDKVTAQAPWEYSGLFLPRDQMICNADELQR